jgi:acetyl esterase/lipase
VGECESRIWNAFLLAPWLSRLLAFAELKTDIGIRQRPGAPQPYRLDASIPDGEGPFPTVIVVHGGGWRNGNKRMFVDTSGSSRSRRLDFVWIFHRLPPRSRAHASPRGDGCRERNSIRAVARSRYKVDLIDRAHGESAVDYGAFVGARTARTQAAAYSFYAPVDLEAMVVGQDKKDEAIKALQALLDVTEPNDEAIRRLREASPIKYVKKGMPPFLLIHGNRRPASGFPAVHHDVRKDQGCGLFVRDLRGRRRWPWRQWLEKNPAFQGYKNEDGSMAEAHDAMRITRFAAAQV